MIGFVLTIGLVLGAVAGGIAAVIFRRRKWIALVIGFAVFAGSIAWLLSPSCVPMSAEDAARFDPPIETRTDTNVLGQRYFQHYGGAWHHCKTRIASEMFF